MDNTAAFSRFLRRPSPQNALHLHGLSCPEGYGLLELEKNRQRYPYVHQSDTLLEKSAGIWHTRGMVRRARKAPLALTPDERQELKDLSRSRTAPKRESERATILLLYADGEPVTAISRRVGVAYQTIYNCIDKALAAGPKTGLKDAYHRPKAPVITPEAIAWVVSTACTKPKEHGLAAEQWTLSSLAGFIRERAISHGYACLSRAAKSTVWRILKAHDLKPHRIRYYLERRDPEFDRKIHEVLVVYEEVPLDLMQTDEQQANGQRSKGKCAEDSQGANLQEPAIQAPRPTHTANVNEKMKSPVCRRIKIPRPIFRS